MQFGFLSSSSEHSLHPKQTKMARKSDITLKTYWRTTFQMQIAKTLGNILHCLEPIKRELFDALEITL